MIVTMLRAVVVAHLWQWFVADPFGAPRVGVAETAGIILIVLFAVDLLPAGRNEDTITYNSIAARVGARIVNATVSFLFALILVNFR